MADITAALVKKLRDRTDLPMMDCKKALVETQGDLTEAEEVLRKKFVQKAATRADRETAEGRIGLSLNQPGAGAIVEMRCETNPVAINQVFVELAGHVADAVAASGTTDPETLLDVAVPSTGSAVRAAIAGAFGKIQENMKIARAARLQGDAFAGYVHHNGKIGVVCAFDADPGEVGKQVCMHVAHARPQGLGRDDLQAEAVERARADARQAVPPGKPDEIVEKIVDGKLNKWYGERVLLEQPFVMDDKKTVGQILEAAGRTVTGYCRLELGLLD